MFSAYNTFPALNTCIINCVICVFMRKFSMLTVLTVTSKHTDERVEEQLGCVHLLLDINPSPEIYPRAITPPLSDIYPS